MVEMQGHLGHGGRGEGNLSLFSSHQLLGGPLLPHTSMPQPGAQVLSHGARQFSDSDPRFRTDPTQIQHTCTWGVEVQPLVGGLCQTLS